MLPWGDWKELLRVSGIKDANVRISWIRSYGLNGRIEYVLWSINVFLCREDEKNTNFSWEFGSNKSEMSRCTVSDIKI